MWKVKLVGPTAGCDFMDDTGTRARKCGETCRKILPALKWGLRVAPRGSGQAPSAAPISAGRCGHRDIDDLSRRSATAVAPAALSRPASSGRAEHAPGSPTPAAARRPWSPWRARRPPPPSTAGLRAAAQRPARQPGPPHRWASRAAAVRRVCALTVRIVAPAGSITVKVALGTGDHGDGGLLLDRDGQRVPPRPAQVHARDPVDSADPLLGLRGVHGRERIAGLDSKGADHGRLQLRARARDLDGADPQRRAACSSAGPLRTGSAAPAAVPATARRRRMRTPPAVARRLPVGLPARDAPAVSRPQPSAAPLAPGASSTSSASSDDVARAERHDDVARLGAARRGAPAPPTRTARR